MSPHEDHSNQDDKHPDKQDNLVTERDNDEQFGLFREDSFPDSGEDEVQKRVIDNELPRDNKLRDEDKE